MLSGPPLRSTERARRGGAFPAPRAGPLAWESDRARHESDFNRLQKSKHELMDVLSEVVVELDKERVSQEEFEHFSFTWQAVDALVRDRVAFVGNTLAKQGESS